MRCCIDRNGCARDDFNVGVDDNKCSNSVHFLHPISSTTRRIMISGLLQKGLLLADAEN